MPLISDERTAVKLIANFIDHNAGGASGAISFARNYLGAHYEQAKRLVTLGSQVASGDALLDDLEFEDKLTDSIQVTKETGDGAIDVSLKAGALPITSYDALVDFYDIDTDVWHPVDQVFNFWGSAENPHFQVKARFKEQKYQALTKEDRQALIEDMAAHAPHYEPVRYSEYSPDDAEHLLEIMINDLHAEKLAQGWGLDKVGEAIEGSVRTFIARAAPYRLGKVVLVFNGDTFHVDNLKNTTTAGTPQEVSTFAEEVFRSVRGSIVRAIDSARQVAPVEVLVLRGNHDYERAFYLADTLAAWYRNDAHTVVREIPSDREYLRWGSTLLGFTHGKETKPTDLPLLMMRENSTDGVNSFQWHAGHFHTRQSQEYQGVLIRWFGTPATPGPWDQMKGYGNNERQLTGMVWHKTEGQVAEFYWRSM